MLSLSQHNASLSNLNIRTERHGDERQLAADLKLTCNVAGVVLNDIEQGLHDSLFRMPASSGEQPDLIDPALLTAVKFPHLQPVVLTHKFPGYEADIGSDADDEPLFLPDLELKKITAKPIEGGSAEISFSLSGNIETDDVSRLAELLVREDVVLTITPPARPQLAADLSGAPENAEGERCEGNAADCGPVAHHDSQGVPLCQRCWDSLEADSAAANDAEGSQGEAA